MTYQEAQGVLRALISEATARKSDEYYELKVNDLAEVAGRVFDIENNKTQMKNLENVALYASSLSEVFNYIKSQAGKEGGKDADKPTTGALWRKDMFAKKLINALQKVVVIDAGLLGEGIWAALLEIDSDTVKVLEAGHYEKNDLIRYLRLHLGRLFIQHLVAHYTYSQRALA